MKWSRRLTWVLVASITLALMSVLAFLYAKTQHRGESDYFENVALLRHVKQLDAQWELDVLKSKIGINVHYDPLADSLMELSQLLERLETAIQTQAHDETAVLVQGGAMLRQAIQEKSVLIERFKSNNAVLRNSLVFLPTAAVDIQPSVSATHSSPALESGSVLGSVNKLLLASMLFSQSASDERKAEIEAELNQLDIGKRLLAPEQRDRVEVFGAHVRTILREQGVVNGLLSSIAAVPTAARIDEVHNALSDEQQRVQVQNLKYREYLLGFSAVLIALFVYLAMRLIRSHAEINRVNRQLYGANENLEQRVQERTLELRQAQSELVTTARQAGMAEIATNVLHNVGNVLNSVNVSAGVVTSRLRASKVHGLAQAVSLMKEHGDDLGGFLTADAKGRMLPGYLGQLAEVLVAEQRSAVEELAALSKSVDHIKEIIATQQAYAGSSRMTEPVQIHILIDDALRMNAGALTRHHVVVEKSYAPVPELPLDKARILQILVNLISNAKQALEGVAERELRLALSVDLMHGQKLRVRVADNGVGIAPEHLTRIFAHGFTTKQDGHGFGLHGAVVAAREMGGTLTAESAGLGTGAVFTLELPLSVTEEAP